MPRPTANWRLKWGCKTKTGGVEARCRMEAARHTPVPQPGPSTSTHPPTLVLETAKLIRSTYYSSAISNAPHWPHAIHKQPLHPLLPWSHTLLSNRVLHNPHWRTSLGALQKLWRQGEGISSVRLRDTFDLHPRSRHLGNNTSTSRTDQKCDQELVCLG